MQPTDFDFLVDFLKHEKIRGFHFQTGYFQNTSNYTARSSESNASG